jgi:hypothetical protein
MLQKKINLKIFKLEFPILHLLNIYEISYYFIFWLIT